MRHQNHFVSGLVWCVISSIAAGCGSGAIVKRETPTAAQHLRTISRAYLQATKELDRPPESLDELTPFLKKLGDPEQILKSPNDGEPYKIFWGVDVLNLELQGGRFPVLAYEQHGKDGKRFVLEVRYVHQMTDEELKKAVFPPGQRAPG